MNGTQGPTELLRAEFRFRIFVLAGILCSSPASQPLAGEIAGMRPQLPPSIDPDVTINFSNDFLGRGGSVDDFRTTQTILTAKIGDRWDAVLDHSILTLDQPPLMARTDQFAASLGRRFVDNRSAQRLTTFTAGFGLRSVGDYSGEKMQNGFHQLVGSAAKSLPYVGGSTTDGTVWADAERYASFHMSGGSGFLGGWSSGYWLRGSALATTDTQLDAALGAYLITSKNSMDIWLGARRDWRSGYDQDIVQHATAVAEDDLAAVFGIRFGALVIETVQQFNNDASYGQLKLVADGKTPFPSGEWPRFGVGLGFILPDVHLQLAAKYRTHFFQDNTSDVKQSIVFDTRYGKPQYQDDPDIYIESRQLSLGMEWEKAFAGTMDWISAYGSTGVGWRSEQLLGDGTLIGQKSETESSAIGVLGAGLRFSAASLGKGWRYRLQLGLTSWVPFSSATVLFDGQSQKLLGSNTGITIGMTFDYD